MRIVFVISSLSSGGAERVMSIMANYWVQKGKDIAIITIDSKESNFYLLNSRVKRVALALMKPSLNPLEAFRSNFCRVKRLRKEILDLHPDLVISFVDKTNVLTLLATSGLNIRVVVSERIDPSEHSLGWVWQILRWLLYRHASAVVVQSEQVSRWARTFIRKNGVCRIPNPVNVPPPLGKNCALVLPAGKIVMSMGRLTQQKGYDLLLQAFTVCARKHPDWWLLIVGEGEERDRLETLAGELGIANRVILPGRIKDPIVVLRKAEFFVLSSRYEGFPNALLEAMACGLPVVSFDCRSGPGEIIRNGIDGLLVPPEDVDALAKAMDQLMSDEAKRKRFGQCARRVTERFSVEKVMGMWEKLVDEVLVRNAA